MRNQKSQKPKFASKSRNLKTPNLRKQRNWGGGGASGGAEKPFNGVQLRSVSPKAQDFLMNMKKREMETSCEDLG